MAKLRRHRKEYHPKEHRRSVAKAMVTKGYDEEWQRKAKRDPSLYAIKDTADPLEIKARRKLVNIPKVLAYADWGADGLIRVLRRENDVFPEFALYLARGSSALKESLIDAGLKEEGRGKWVLRTKRFSIFVYL